jgi:hypothetical protein
MQACAATGAEHREKINRLIESHMAGHADMVITRSIVNVFCYDRK